LWPKFAISQPLDLLLALWGNFVTNTGEIIAVWMKYETSLSDWVK